MQSEAAFYSLLVGFLLVVTRIGAFFVFIPLPGTRSFPAAPKIVLTLAVSLMLFRFWPVQRDVASSVSSVVVAMAAEAALGLAVGTGTALVIETMQLAGQFIGLQAGFSYASTIDPNSEADSSILLILWQLLTSLTIFAMGLDREILSALAGSFERIPPGSYHLTKVSAMGVLAIGGQMFPIGVRLSLPVIAVLMVADISLAFLGKVEQHLQLSGLLFSLKTLAGLVILALVMSSSGRLIEQWLATGWRSVHTAVGF